MSGERLAFRLSLDEQRPLEVECFPGTLDRVHESDVGLLGLLKVPPLEPIAVCGIVAVIPAPQLVDHDGGRSGSR